MVWIELSPKKSTNTTPIGVDNPVDALYYYPWAKDVDDMEGLDWQHSSVVQNRELNKEETLLVALIITLDLHIAHSPRSWASPNYSSSAVIQATIDSTTTLPLGPFGAPTTTAFTTTNPTQPIVASLYGHIGKRGSYIAIQVGDR